MIYLFNRSNLQINSKIDSDDENFNYSNRLFYARSFSFVKIFLKLFFEYKTDFEKKLQNLSSCIIQCLFNRDEHNHQHRKEQQPLAMGVYIYSNSY